MKHEKIKSSLGFDIYGCEKAQEKDFMMLSAEFEWCPYCGEKLLPEQSITVTRSQVNEAWRNNVCDITLSLNMFCRALGFKE